MSGLYGGDPRKLFLDGDDEPSRRGDGIPEAGASGFGALDARSPAADAPSTGVLDDETEDPTVTVGSRDRLSPVPSRDDRAPVRRSRSSLIERVRSGAVRHQSATQPIAQDVSVFDHGYSTDPAPGNPPSLLERVRGAAARRDARLDENGLQATTSLSMPAAVLPQTTLPGVTPAEAPTERIGVDSIGLHLGLSSTEPGPTPQERSTGPLRIFVGGTRTSREEALGDDSQGPVWDAASLAARSPHEGSGDWGDSVGAPDGAQVAAASPYEPREAEVTGLGAQPTTKADSLGDIGVFPAERGGGAQGAERPPASTLPADAEDHTGLPWWGTEKEAPGAASRTAEPGSVPPALRMNPRSRLEEELSQAVPTEASTTVRRQAPYADPDPWTTGAFRKIALPLADEGSRPLEDSLDGADAERGAAPTSPEHAAVSSRDARLDRRGRQLLVFVLAVLLVVLSTVVWVQLADLPDPRVGPTARAVLTDSQGVGDPEALAMGEAGAAESRPVSGPPESGNVQSLAAASSLPPLASPDETRADAETGLLEVRAAAGRWVRVDGRVVGRAPLDLQRLSPGAHLVQVGATASRVTVAPGRLTQIQF